MGANRGPEFGGALPPLGFLKADARPVVMAMLSAVADYPEVYDNRVLSGGVRPDRGGGFEYAVAQRNEQGSAPFPQTWRLPDDIMPQLEHFEFVVSEDGPNRSHWHRFTDEALAWHAIQIQPSDAEVRRRIGRHLYRQFEQPGDELQAFDPAVVSAAAEVDEARVVGQARVMQALELVATEVPINGSEFGHLQLSKPTGARWAAAGFPDEVGAAGTTVNVTLDLRVEVQNVINEARSTEVPRALLEQFEARVRRVEEQLERPDGRFESVNELMETANQSKDLLGPAVKFLYRNWDRIEHLADAVGSMV